MTDEQLIANYLTNGGTITKIDQPWPDRNPHKWEGKLMPTSISRGEPILPMALNGRRTRVRAIHPVVDETTVNYG